MPTVTETIGRTREAFLEFLLGGHGVDKGICSLRAEKTTVIRHDYFSQNAAAQIEHELLLNREGVEISWIQQAHEQP